MKAKYNLAKMNFFAMLCLWFCCTVQADTKIAVLDFELHDLTLKPNIAAEVERTASIKPLLEKELQTAEYKIVPIDKQAQQQASAGIGYLFDHAEAAAKLAQTVGAEYIIVGKLHKPSFLFAYLMVHLIRVNNAAIIGNYISEIKGADKKLTLKGVEDLTVKIDHNLDKRYTQPPPVSKSIH